MHLPERSVQCAECLGEPSEACQAAGYLDKSLFGPQDTRDDDPRRQGSSRSPQKVVKLLALFAPLASALLVHHVLGLYEQNGKHIIIDTLRPNCLEYLCAISTAGVPFETGLPQWSLVSYSKIRG